MGNAQGTETTLTAAQRSGAGLALGLMIAHSIRVVPLFLVALFAWNRSHLQYDIYLPDDLGLLSYRITVIVTCVMAAFALTGRYPLPMLRAMLAYILLAGLHCVLDEVLIGEGKSFLFIEAMVFALLMLPIACNRHVLFLFIRINFILGLVLILLSTMPVLHWLEVVELPYRIAQRFAGEQGLFELDPYFFGIFGLTESYVPVGHPVDVPRLQGFSFEPIHWSYFVYLTLACALFLLSQRRGILVRPALVGVLAIVATHLFFVFSTTAFLAVVGWVGVLGFMWLYRRRLPTENGEAWGVMIVAVLLPGLLIPFAIAQIPDIDYLLWAGDVLSKGSNWEGKIGFASLGNALYTRFLPALGEVPSAGHNYVLSTYLTYGYILALPLLAFLLLFIRRTIVGMPFMIVAGSVLTILGHTIVVPPQFFYASGAMWFAIALGVAYHARADARA